MTLLSNIYDVVNNNRGKAGAGFIRPTLSEHFMTDHDFVEVEFSGRANGELFDKVKTVKPKSSRVESREVFILGMGFRGRR